MPWWGWAIVGIVLLAAELVAIDAQFYLIFVGAGAIVVGLAQFLGADMPFWGQWIAFALISFASMFTLRKQLYAKFRGRAVGHVDSVVGARVHIAEALEPGARCRAEFRGSTWTALNVGDEAIEAGSDARVAAVQGLTLEVRA